MENATLEEKDKHEKSSLRLTRKWLMMLKSWIMGNLMIHPDGEGGYAVNCVNWICGLCFDRRYGYTCVWLS